jgi:hypothetical protein
MLPFIEQLSVCGAQDDIASSGTELASIERIAATFRLVRDYVKIGIDRGARRSVGTEALELRMMAISPRLAPKDGAGKKTLSPQSHQALAVEVLGVKGPKAQAHHLEPELRGRGARPQHVPPPTRVGFSAPRKGRPNSHSESCRP